MMGECGFLGMGGDPEGQAQALGHHGLLEQQKPGLCVRFPNFRCQPLTTLFENTTQADRSAGHRSLVHANSLAPERPACTEPSLSLLSTEFQRGFPSFLLASGGNTAFLFAIVSFGKTKCQVYHFKHLHCIPPAGGAVT